MACELQRMRAPRRALWRTGGPMLLRWRCVALMVIWCPFDRRTAKTQPSGMGRFGRPLRTTSLAATRDSMVSPIWWLWLSNTNPTLGTHDVLDDPSGLSG